MDSRCGTRFKENGEKEIGTAKRPRPTKELRKKKNSLLTTQ